MTNLFKSIFISVFTMLALAFFLHGITEIIFSGARLTWAGTAVSSLTILAFFTWLLVGDNARTSRKLHGWTTLVSLATVVIFLDGTESQTPIYYGAIMLAGWLAYVFWYSALNSNAKKLKQGDVLPEFQLETFDEKPVNFNAPLERPTLFLFYRGNWCPLCMAQIKEIAEQYKRIVEKGVNIVLASPQPHRYSRSLAEKFDAPLQFLVDKKNTAARKLGIEQKFGLPAGFQILGYKSETVLPTIIIADSQGKIVYWETSDNYRVRPEPKTFLKVINQLPELQMSELSS